MLLRLASSLVIVVRQAGWLADVILPYGKIHYPGAYKCFLVFNAVINAEWSKTIQHKSDFCHIWYFHDGIRQSLFSGACHFRGEPY